MAEPLDRSSASHALFEKAERRGISLRAYGESASGEVLFSHGDPSLPLALTGVTRMFLVAMILRDIDRGALALETPITDVLPASYAHGLCVISSTDFTTSITVGHLLSGSSGIPNFFDPPAKGIRSLCSQLVEQDRSWSLPEALELARHYPGLFRPGARTGHHSPTGDLLLGELLRETTGMALPALLELRVTKPLGLNSTYFFAEEHHSTFYSLAPIHHRGKVVHIPQALSSLGAAGGVVSTPRDTVRFIHALWAGSVFSSEWSPQIQARPQAFGLHAARGANHTAAVTGVSGISAGFNSQSRAAGLVATQQWDGGPGASDYLAKALKLA